MLKACGLRLDVTVLKGLMLGRHFNKTYGHYHVGGGQEAGCVEVYRVLYGRALYLFQKPGEVEPDVVEDCVAVLAGPGDTVVLPRYGYVTVNVGGGPLVMANIVVAEVCSDYALFRSLMGAAFYTVASVSAGRPGALWLVGNSPCTDGSPGRGT